MKWFSIIVIAVAFLGEIGQNFWFNFQQADTNAQHSITNAINNFRKTDEYVRRRKLADDRIAQFRSLAGTLDQQNRLAIAEKEMLGKGSTVRAFDGRIHEADDRIAEINADFDAWAAPQEARIVDGIDRQRKRSSDDNFLGLLASVSIGAVMSVIAIGLAFSSSRQKEYSDARTLFFISLFAQFASCMIQQIGVELKTDYAAFSYIYSLAYMIGVPAYIHWNAHHITGFRGVSIFKPKPVATTPTPIESPPAPAALTVVSSEREERRELPEDVAQVKRLADYCIEHDLPPTYDNLEGAATALHIPMKRSTIYRKVLKFATFQIDKGMTLKDLVEGMKES